MMPLLLHNFLLLLLPPLEMAGYRKVGRKADLCICGFFFFLGDGGSATLCTIFSLSLSLGSASMCTSLRSTERRLQPYCTAIPPVGAAAIAGLLLQLPSRSSLPPCLSCSLLQPTFRWLNVRSLRHFVLIRESFDELQVSSLLCL